MGKMANNKDPNARGTSVNKILYKIELSKSMADSTVLTFFWFEVLIKVIFYFVIIYIYYVSARDNLFAFNNSKFDKNRIL